MNFCAVVYSCRELCRNGNASYSIAFLEIWHEHCGGERFGSRDVGLENILDGERRLVTKFGISEKEKNDERKSPVVVSLS